MNIRPHGPLVLASVDAGGEVYHDASGALFRVVRASPVATQHALFEISGDEITADSTPDYDAFGPDSAWACHEWIEWHVAMAKKYGLATADRRWREAWLAGLSRFAGGRATAPGTGEIFDAVPIACRTLDEDFRKYVRAHPVLFETVYHGLAGALTAPFGALVDVGRDTSLGLSRFVGEHTGLAIGLVVIAGLVYTGAAPALVKGVKDTVRAARAK